MMAVVIAASAFNCAARSVKDFFVSAPRQVIPLLDKNSRLDMIDYFNSGLGTSTPNNLGGGSALTSLGDNRMDIKLTEGSNMELALVSAGTDTLLVVINTVLTPVADSKLAMYSPDWSANVTSRTFATPSLSDWLTQAGSKRSGDVAQVLPFMLVQYDFAPETGILTLTNNTRKFVGEEIYQIVEGLIYPQLIYKWNGKKFEKQKQ